MVWCDLFCCSLFVVRCSLCVVRCLLVASCFLTTVACQGSSLSVYFVLFGYVCRVLFDVACC